MSANLKLYPHQRVLRDKILEVLRRNNLCYVAAEERVGKTYAALDAAIKYGATNILIVTKLRAIEGWKPFIDAVAETGVPITLINYESAHKIQKQNYDFAILDEAHNFLSAYPRPGKYCRTVQSLTYNVPILLLSATPSAQSYSQLFHQLNMSKFSPWDSYRNFYAWHRDVGIPKTLYAAGRFVNDYSEIDVSKIQPIIDTYFVSMTRAEAGFTEQPTDKLHYVELDSETYNLAKRLNSEGVIRLNGKTLAPQSRAHTVVALHELEGGTMKFEDGSSENLQLPRTKIQYITDNFGDSKDIAIMYNYKQEQHLLGLHFRKALLLQSSSAAEGVDLSHIDSIIVYSMNWSVAKYIQRRARQCNVKRAKPIIVHYILAKNLPSDKIYKCVAMKGLNFTASYYTDKELR